MLQGGEYILNLMDMFVGGFLFLFVGFFEIIVIIYVYGKYLIYCFVIIIYYICLVYLKNLFYLVMYLF